MREVRQRDDQIGQFGLGLFQLLVELFRTLFEGYGLLFGGVGFGLFACLEQLSDLFGDGILLGQVGIQFGLNGFAGIIQLFDAIHRCGGIHTLHGQTLERKGFVVSDLLKCQHVFPVLYFIFDIFSQWSKDTKFSYLCHYEAYFCPFAPKCRINRSFSHDDVECLCRERLVSHRRCCREF